jgi:hypothetical protein
MQIEEAIVQLGQKMGVVLQLDANRACRLVFDGTLAVDFEAPQSLPDQLVMSCVVGSDIFPQGRLAVLQSLLEANLFGRGAGGAMLALDEERGDVLLQRTLNLSRASLQDLLNALEQLLKHAEAWVERLKAGPGDSPYAPMDSSRGVTSTMWIGG